MIIKNKTLAFLGIGAYILSVLSSATDMNGNPVAPTTLVLASGLASLIFIILAVIRLKKGSKGLAMALVLSVAFLIALSTIQGVISFPYGSLAIILLNLVKITNFIVLILVIVKLFRMGPISTLPASNDIVSKTLLIVISSKRSMPAYFTWDGEKTKSFGVNFPELSAIDEYEMASEVWHSLRINDISKDEYNFILRTGEDIMLGAYIITKLNGAEYIPKVIIGIIDNLTEVFKERFTNLGELYSKPEVLKYFEHCSEFGKNRALL